MWAHDTRCPCWPTIGGRKMCQKLTKKGVAPAVSLAPQTHNIMTRQLTYATASSPPVPSLSPLLLAQPPVAQKQLTNTMSGPTDLQHYDKTTHLCCCLTLPGAATATHVAITITLTTGDSTATYGAETTHQHQTLMSAL